MEKRKKNKKAASLVDRREVKGIVGAPKGKSPFPRKRSKRNSPLIGNARRTYYIK